jgi:hypothetical protein
LLDTATLTTIQSDISALEDRLVHFDVDTTARTLDLDSYHLTVAQLSLQGDPTTSALGSNGGLYLVDAGGSVNQILAKASATDGDFQWIDQLTATGATGPQGVSGSAGSVGATGPTGPSAGGGGTTQTINTINYNAKPFFGPSAITSTNYGSTTLGAGFYMTNSNGWLSPSGGVVTIPYTDLCYDSNNRNFTGALEIFARNTSSGSPKNAYAHIACCLRPGASTMSFTLNLQFNQSIGSWSIANGGTQNIRVSVDSDCFVCWAWRGAI